MIRATTDFKDAESKLNKLETVFAEGAFDQPVEIAAFKTHRGLIAATPKKWTGHTRKAWMIEKPGLGSRLVVNRSKVMLFLEGGTGLKTGGWIVPKTKKFLFIPLTAAAALSGGWNSTMQFGRDYVLKKRVRGIQAMRIVEKFRVKASEILKGEMKAFLERVLK